MDSRLSLASFDLNLLVQLNLLLQESSVSGAADRAGVTQSAMSRALGRLRTAFDDELLVQVGRTMEPTAFAKRLMPALRSILGDIDRRILSPPTFSPAEAEAEFRIAAIDFAEVLLLAPLMAKMAEAAPGVSFALTGTQEVFRGGLTRGDVDLAIGIVSGDRASIKSRRLLTDRFVCAMRRDHPAAAKETVTVDDYADSAHVLVSPSGRGGGQVDAALADAGTSRHVAIRASSFQVALEFAAQRNLLVTVPNLVATHFRSRCDTVVYREIDVPLPPLALSMLWHTTRHSDPAHTWLRSQIVEVASSLEL